MMPLAIQLSQKGIANIIKHSVEIKQIKILNIQK